MRPPSLRGLTLVETLISLAIVALVAGIDFGTGIDSYERSLARSNRTELLWSLLTARAAAMHGICNGNACDSAELQTVILPDAQNVNFLASSGRVAIPASSNDGSSTISVNSEGQISLIP